MPIVTDKEYHLDQGLKEFLDLCVERYKKKWDNVIIIDGKERAGKSTLARQMGYYYAQQIGKQFTLDNVFFDPDELLEFAKNNTDQVIIWDEAAFGMLANEWQSKLQQTINKALMTCGKYRHFWVFIIPTFFRLNRYVALDRSIGLIHVYSPDLINRGCYLALNEQNKTWVYNNNRKSESYGKSFSFRGRFVMNTILDEEQYDIKKDAAIQKFVSLQETKKESKATQRYNDARKRAIQLNLPSEIIEEIFDISGKTVKNEATKLKVLAKSLQISKLPMPQNPACAAVIVQNEQPFSKT